MPRETRLQTKIDDVELLWHQVSNELATVEQRLVSEDNANRKKSLEKQRNELVEKRANLERQIANWRKQLPDQEASVAASWPFSANALFGTALLLFMIATVFFALPAIVPFTPYVIALCAALLAAMLFPFMLGDIKLKTPGLDSSTGKGVIQATGGVAVLLAVLVWWPKTVNDVYQVRVNLLDVQGTPVDDARVWSSVGGEAKQVAGGWEFVIPLSSRPQNGQFIVYAEKKAVFLNGQVEAELADDFNLNLTLQLQKDNSAIVQGVVQDASGNGIAGAKVNIYGKADLSTTTDASGNFRLSADAADGQEVRLHVEKDGYNPVDQYHPAGDAPATVIIGKE